MDRRTFLELSALMGAASALDIDCVFGQLNSPGNKILGATSSSITWSDRQAFVPDSGWRMWPDRQAAWKEDTIFLPEDVRLEVLDVHPPTGGWEALTAQQGIEVTLPATVEQFFWGLDGFRPYQDEYKFETSDDEVKNGAYYGVSWWWRSLEIPEAWKGQRIFLHVRGARQRAEVYLNRQLVGYSMMEELPFECDLTKAARPGTLNQLAIRITNPGGRLDWVDNSKITWGGITFQKSHGFGGIDRGLSLSAHGDVRIADTWVLNTPAEREILPHASIENRSGNEISGKLRFSVIHPEQHKSLAAIEVPLTVPTGKTHTADAKLSVPSAELWDLDSPRVYRLRCEWIGDNAAVEAAREVDFGFRWITVDGLGSNAVFRLNGRRIRIYTSISWGYWALNGLFPIPELAEKEVRAAKQLNLNCLNFHRNLAKEDVLYVQDRLGLMRCLEPGGGIQALQPARNGDHSAQRYMTAKILGMIRAYRSHPSVIHYIVQNEASLQPQSPELADLFARVQAEDPSRTIVGNDGFTMRSPQAWSQPYSAEIHKSETKATLDGGAAGWWDDHTGHFSDVWQDSYYNSPADFYYRSPIRGEIVEWGEMKGAASIDNHVSALREITKHGGKSYDLLDHQEILKAYETFLDRWGFRSAFPNTEGLFLSIGRRAYDSWAQFMENVRICNENDMAAISGWESTAMENHSGLVDNFRDWKADPKGISSSLLPVHPVAKQRQLVFKTGDRAAFDAYLLNDSGRAVHGSLTLTLKGPGRASETIATFPVPPQEPDRLSYLLKENIETPALSAPGTWQTRFMLNGDGACAHECHLLVVDPVPAGMRRMHIAVAGVTPAIEASLRSIPGLDVSSFRAGERYDAIVASGGSAESSKNLDVDAEGAYKPSANHASEEALAPEVFVAIRSGIPLLAVTPTDPQSIGVAKQLSKWMDFKFNGMVGPSRASWMGSWYFVRKHPLYDGLPVDQAMSIHYQVKGGGSNGWLVDGSNVEIVAAYSRDHDRNIGAGTFTVKSQGNRVVMHRIADMHPVLLQRFLANALLWLTA